MKNVSRPILYLMWVIGLIVLMIVWFHLYQVVRQYSSAYYTLIVEAWFSFLAPFIVGAYMALVFVPSWRFAPNKVLLTSVFLPTFLISIWIPIAVMTSASSGGLSLIPVPMWLTKSINFGIPELVSGLTLVCGMFGSLGVPRADNEGDSK